ncbi:hypothetical protein C6Y14_12925 [Streptomyces dioscori]|uniref:UL36 very large tegument protein n=1 Tax=Streptomyces dioscori TaxID=2109333 RepID=A0A2P8Q9X7_9ACTN|nr:hypothetical protein [Streptomyces dioscori]PSM43060.1 hypothetical protein C6Y14_12925 [Streptomyces dioscori]
MTVEQLPDQVREFAHYLSGLLSRLDQGGGWCGVFWQRDPDGMRACLEGWEVPPWDVVEAILQDLGAEYGDRAAALETERARALHAASLAAYDARPGGRDALGDRLDVMLREQRYAAERLTELGRSLPEVTTQEEGDSLRLDLAWARDDHDRATARCAEIRARIDELDRRAMDAHVRGGSGGGDPVRTAVQEAVPRLGVQRAAPDEDDWPDLWRDASANRAARQDAAAQASRAGSAQEAAAAHPEATEAPDAHASHLAPEASGATEHPAPPETPAPKQRSKRRLRGGARGSARFAGMTDAKTDPDAGTDTGTGAGTAGGASSPVSPGPPVPRPADRTPRGARFAGGAEESGGGGPRAPRREPLDDDARRTTVETVATLVRLRGEGRTGEAHAVLVEAAHWPAARFPLLAAELHRAGLDADWASLLWEAVSLPADRLVAAADALVAAGRTADGRQMLRQGVARPAPEIGEAVLGLVEEGRHREVRALLDAYVRVRTPEEAARSIDADPQFLAPLLLEAAREVSEQRYWDLIHALRVAGYTA